MRPVPGSNRRMEIRGKKRLRGRRVGSNRIRYERRRAEWRESRGGHGIAAGPSGRPQLIAKRSHLIASYHRRLLQTELSLSSASRSEPVLRRPSRLLPVAPLPLASLFNPPTTDSTSSRTYHCRSISISDRLAPTSQECDTARNSFELHISLGPAK